MMMPMHFAKRHEVASKGAMVPRLKLLPNEQAMNSTKMTTIPFPNKMAFHNFESSLFKIFSYILLFLYLIFMFYV